MQIVNRRIAMNAFAKKQHPCWPEIPLNTSRMFLTPKKHQQTGNNYHGE